MDYWKGIMNWPISDGWRCQTCGGSSLMWGLRHAHARCVVCHTEYSMRDENGERVETPICLLKVEYVDATKLGYKKWKRPISEWTDEMWDAMLELA